MPATKRYRNWTDTTFNAVAIDGIRRAGWDNGVTDIQEGADADAYPSIAIVTFQSPTFTIMTFNAMILMTTLAGLNGVFATCLNDAKNGNATGGGAYVFTTNALSYIGGRSIDGDYNQLATQNLTIKTASVDGVTNPVGVAPK